MMIFKVTYLSELQYVDSIKVLTTRPQTHFLYVILNSPFYLEEAIIICLCNNCYFDFQTSVQILILNIPNISDLQNIC